MGGWGGEQSLVVAWPTADFASLPMSGGVAAAFKNEILAAPDPAAKQREIEARFEGGTDPFNAAARFTVHGVIMPNETRPRTSKALALARSRRSQAPGPNMRHGVMPWLPNGLECIRIWFGINWLGATYVPINTAYRGALLEHVLDNAGAELIIVHADLAPRLAEVGLAAPKKAVIVGGEPPRIAGLQLFPEDALDAPESDLPELAEPIEPWHMQSIIYTSGTTGPSKGVMSSYAHLHAMAGPEDREHPLRKVIIVPLAEDAPAFAKRFGVETYTLYNMTEISTPLVSGLDPTKTGSCGQPRAGVELRVVDENDCEVPQGGVGELIVRTSTPWAMNSGYYKNPEATARAWRNGWFHTGDAFRVDEDGTFFFVDRMKDAIRRRGENISSFEVEAEIATFPAVAEVAVYAVPSELAEDEVMCAVAAAPGIELDPVALIEHLVSRLPYFMVPRYLRVVEALPKTPTQKVQKHILRAEGITADTWDREAAGITIRRETIGG